MKSITVKKAEKTYIVKFEPGTANNKKGLFVIMFCDTENSEFVMRHFLDFSKFPDNEIEKNVIKFAEHFNEKDASEWVDGYLAGK